MSTMRLAAIEHRSSQRAGQLYRGIASPHVDFYREILTGWRRDGLIDAGLVETRLTESAVEGFDLVVEHAVIYPETFPFEWPGKLLKEASLFFLRFARRLAAWGIGLKDAHGYSLLCVSIIGCTSSTCAPWFH